MQNVVYVVQKNTLTATGGISSSSIIGVASTESEIKKIITRYIINQYNQLFSGKLQKLGSTGQICSYYTLNIHYGEYSMRFYAEPYTID